MYFTYHKHQRIFAGCVVASTKEGNQTQELTGRYTLGLSQRPRQFCGFYLFQKVEGLKNHGKRKEKGQDNSKKTVRGKLN
jgi:hypothetical protein